MENKIVSIIRRNYKNILGMTGYEQSTLEKVLTCKTEPVPSLHTSCDLCSVVRPVMKSCKNRLCPICNGAASLKWLAKREQEMLPVNYFLLTFTVPKQLHPIFISNKGICYELLFKAVSTTLIECIRNNNRTFQGHAGFFTVLHTWDQRVNYHPHIHVVIPGGCLSPDKTRWNKSHDNFLLPVRKLSALFRNRLLYYIFKKKDTAALFIPPGIENMENLYNELAGIPWVVHSQAPGKGREPQRVLRYLSKYVNKSAIDDNRIIKMEKGSLYLRYVDRNKNIPKTEALTEEVFMKRLIMHILPKGFKRTRFYGFMANRYRHSMLSLCRDLLGLPLGEQEEVAESLLTDTAFLFWKYFHVDITLCPDCGEGHIVFIKGPLKGG